MKIDSNKVIVGVAAIYLLMVVVCYGPATVQAEDNADWAYTTCLTISLTPDRCFRDPFPLTKGLAGAIFWPFWLSYKVASRGVDE
jgi:hypothetical protein